MRTVGLVLGSGSRHRRRRLERSDLCLWIHEERLHHLGSETFVSVTSHSDGDNGNCASAGKGAMMKAEGSSASRRYIADGANGEEGRGRRQQRRRRYQRVYEGDDGGGGVGERVKKKILLRDRFF